MRESRRGVPRHCGQQTTPCTRWLWHGGGNPHGTDQPGLPDAAASGISPNCPKNRTGLLSVTIFKQLWLLGDCQHPGSRMVPMQDPAQRQLGGAGKAPWGAAFPLSCHTALSEHPGLNPILSCPKTECVERKSHSPILAHEHCAEWA